MTYAFPHRDDGPNYWNTNGRLPGPVPAGRILNEAIQALAPPSQMTVSQAATEYRVERGLPWNNDQTAYMAEPANMTTSRRYDRLAFIGPPRTGKTAGLIENALCHRITCDPGNFHITCPDAGSARKYSIEKIKGMLRKSPKLRARLVDQSDRLGNLFDKEFRNGHFLTIGGPTLANVSMRDIIFTATTEYDKISDDIEGEGSMWELQAARGRTFLSRKFALAESNPGKEIKDPRWKRTTIHEAPPCDGLLGIYNNTTRGRYYWKCLHCDTPFEPEYACFNYDQTLETPAAMADTVTVLCPAPGCGGVMLPGERDVLNQQGQWLHESECGTLAVPIEDERVRRTTWLGYWLKGAHAAFMTWGEMVLGYESAMATLTKTLDETKLRNWHFQVAGIPYLPRSRMDDSELYPEKLKENAGPWPMGELPDEARFLTVQVDGGKDRFDVQVDAWGPGMERWLIDRFPIAVPPNGAKDRTLRPDLYAEDWAVLEPLMRRTYWTKDKTHGLRPAMMSVDRNGPPGYTEKAYKWWRSLRRNNRHHGIHLLTGVTAGLKNDKGDVIPSEIRAFLAPAQKPNAQYKTVARDLPIIKAFSNVLKDEVSASLLRKEPGPLAYHLSIHMLDDRFEELCAEQRGVNDWEKKNHTTRNETWDLAYYGKALLIVAGVERWDWDNPPAWGLPGEGNANAVRPTDETVQEALAGTAEVSVASNESTEAQAGTVGERSKAATDQMSFAQRMAALIKKSRGELE